MLLAIVDGRLKTLKRCLMNPLQPFALILWNALLVCSMVSSSSFQPILYPLETLYTKDGQTAILTGLGQTEKYSPKYALSCNTDG